MLCRLTMHVIFNNAHAFKNVENNDFIFINLQCFCSTILVHALLEAYLEPEILFWSLIVALNPPVINRVLL